MEEQIEKHRIYIGDIENYDFFQYEHSGKFHISDSNTWVSLIVPYGTYKEFLQLIWSADNCKDFEALSDVHEEVVAMYGWLNGPQYTEFLLRF